jgi:hypothetical protein
VCRYMFHSTGCVVGLVGPRTGPDFMVKRKILPFRELNPGDLAHRPFSTLTELSLLLM